MKTLEDEYIASAMRSLGTTGEPPADAVRQIVANANRRCDRGRAVKVAGRLRPSPQLSLPS